MTARRLLTLLVLLAVAVLGAPGPAGAAPGGGGWVRLAHLSPDTPAVDVRLTADGATEPTVALSGVAYGDVSDYTRVPAGAYTAAMRRAGAPASDPPVLSQRVEVTDGSSSTVAVVGPNAGLTAAVVGDDLTAPAPGQARIRLLQASSQHPTVTVTAVDGPVLAADAEFATATGYAAIPAGSWSLEVAADGARVGSAEGVVVEPGSVNTLVVLDEADGSVTVLALQDAVGSGSTPAGGVETGGGGTADPGPVPVGALVLLACCAVPLLVRRRGSA